MLKCAIKDIFDISGKIALVTGATGSFGKTAAMALAEAGAKVMLTGRYEDTLEATKTEIQSVSKSVEYVIGSPDNESDVQNIIARTLEKFGGLDILITAAGMNKPKAIIEQSLEEWQSIMDVNLKGTYLACREAGKVMITQGRGGKVILVSSVRGKMGMANYTGYCTSKGAVNSLMQSLACEWGKFSINVNAIAPTVFRTPLTQWMFDDQTFYKNILNRIPLGRLAETQDFIGALIFLSSHASDFITGAVLNVDGGYSSC